MCDSRREERPDERLKDFWPKVGMTCIIIIVACVAHGIVFWAFSGMGVVECTNYHPPRKDYGSVMSDSDTAQFYKMNGFDNYGIKERKR